MMNRCLILLFTCRSLYIEMLERWEDSLDDSKKRVKLGKKVLKI